MPERALVWDGCLNVRDLGGFATEDGRTTRRGRIIRSDSVRLLSEAGWQAAVDHGVRTVVDLRTQGELDDDPPDEVPVEVFHVSLFGVPDEARWRELDRAATALAKPEDATRFIYLWALEEHQARFGEAVSAIADARPGGVLVHCMGGKDRTGMVVALLLRLAGVGADDVAADYALSETCLAPREQEWLSRAADDEERARIRRISATPAAAMLGVLEEVERRHGSAEGYLRAAGVTVNGLDRLRSRLLN